MISSLTTPSCNISHLKLQHQHTTSAECTTYISDLQIKFNHQQRHIAADLTCTRDHTLPYRITNISQPFTRVLSIRPEYIPWKSPKYVRMPTLVPIEILVTRRKDVVHNAYDIWSNMLPFIRPDSKHNEHDSSKVKEMNTRIW